MRWIAGAAGLAVVIVGAALLRPQGLIEAQTTEPVRTVKVTRGPLEVTSAATGTFQPLEYVDVGAQLSGQLRAVKVQPGELVRRGQLIAEIDDATAKARLAQTQAALASVRAQLAAKEAQTDHARVQRGRSAGLVERGFISVAEHDTAITNLSALEAEAESLRAQAGSFQAVIEQALTELRFAQVLAPIDGVVVSLLARPGQALNAAQQAPVILRIANLRSLALIAQVSEADIVKLAPGADARFSLLGLSERTFSGRVTKILPAPNIVNSVVFYDAVVNTAQPDELFRIGMTAQVFFVLSRHECMLRIPRIALPADLSPPRRVALSVKGADQGASVVQVDITAVNDLEGGVACDAAEGAGLRDGAEIVVPEVAAAKGRKR